MATEFTRAVWCDICWHTAGNGPDAHTPATWEGTLAVNGDVREIDLCAEHAEAVVTRTVELAMRFGRVPERKRIGRPPKVVPASAALRPVAALSAVSAVPSVSSPAELPYEGGEVEGSGGGAAGFSCPLCGRGYRVQTSLRKHVRTEHPEDAGRLSQRALHPTRCPECGKVCASGAGMAAHRRAQHGIDEPVTAAMRA